MLQSLNKAELDFDLILCIAICDQYNRKWQAMDLFFVLSYVTSKIEKQEKMKENCNGIKEELLKSLTDGEIKFKFG